MQPFSITLFATTSDPEGIRHLAKSNGSGYGVVFNKAGAGFFLKPVPTMSGPG